MVTSTPDREIVAAFLEATERLSLREVGARVPGVSHDDVSRWRRGDWKRLSAKKRRALIEFLEGRDGGTGSVQPEQADLFTLVGERLFTKEGLYQTLTNLGGPGEARDRKIFLVQALHAIADELRKDGLMPPDALLAGAYRDILNDEV